MQDDPPSSRSAQVRSTVASSYFGSAYPPTGGDLPAAVDHTISETFTRGYVSDGGGNVTVTISSGSAKLHIPSQLSTHHPQLATLTTHHPQLTTLTDGFSNMSLRAQRNALGALDGGGKGGTVRGGGKGGGSKGGGRGAAEAGGGGGGVAHRRQGKEEEEAEMRKTVVRNDCL